MLGIGNNLLDLIMTGVIQELGNPRGHQIHEAPDYSLERVPEHLSQDCHKLVVNAEGAGAQLSILRVYGRSSSGHSDSRQTTESLLSWILHSLVPTTEPSNKSASTYVTDTVLLTGEILVVTGRL